MLNTSETLSSDPKHSLKTQLASIYKMFTKYGSSGTPATPDNLAVWAASGSGTTAGSVIGTDLGSSTLNN